MKNSQIKADESILTKMVQACADDGKARELLEAWRRPNGPVCPLLPERWDKRISKLEAQGGVCQGVYFCGVCRQQFTVTVGTELERSHVPLSKWLLALFLLCSSKKFVSANQIYRMIGVTYKTAWFMCHRIRFRMPPPDWAPAKLTGTVEVDETFGAPVNPVKTYQTQLHQTKPSGVSSGN